MMKPSNTVVFTLEQDQVTGQLTVGFQPAAFLGNVLQEENLKQLVFESLYPFAIYVARRMAGPNPTVFSPFRGRRILKSQLDAADGVYRLTPAEAKVDIPSAKFGYYEFCYLVILFTEDPKYPVVVSTDPKIIIGKQNQLDVHVRPEIVTAEQCLHRFFPEVGPLEVVNPKAPRKGRKKPVSKSKAAPKKKVAAKSKAARKSPAGKPKSKSKK